MSTTSSPGIQRSALDVHLRSLGLALCDTVTDNFELSYSYKWTRGILMQIAQGIVGQHYALEVSDSARLLPPTSIDEMSRAVDIFFRRALRYRKFATAALMENRGRVYAVIKVDPALSSW